MKIEPKISVWTGCDLGVADALREFKTKWGPYSIESRRYPIFRLIREIIDPALSTYASTLDTRYKGFFAGVGADMAFSETIKLVGLDTMLRLQKQLLHQFVVTENKNTPEDITFVATIESLIGLIWDCDCKLPVKSSLRAKTGKSRGLNGQRPIDYCRFCGSFTSLTTFVRDEQELRGTDDILRLSNRYCPAHQPKLPDGSWNPRYKQAKRSVNQFDLELERISKQCAQRSRTLSTGDNLIDEYFFLLMLGIVSSPADKNELRDLARRMVDSKLSDIKKKMVVLKKRGFNQTEIGNILKSPEGKPMTRQAVSKALATVRQEFLLCDV